MLGTVQWMCCDYNIISPTTVKVNVHYTTKNNIGTATNAAIKHNLQNWKKTIVHHFLVFIYFPELSHHHLQYCLAVSCQSILSQTAVDSLKMPTLLSIHMIRHFEKVLHSIVFRKHLGCLRKSASSFYWTNHLLKRLYAHVRAYDEAGHAGNAVDHQSAYIVRSKRHCCIFSFGNKSLSVCWINYNRQMFPVSKIAQSSTSRICCN